MLISFIVPVFNGENYIIETLESILAQPCQDFEIICVDDGSTDKSSSIIDSYAKQCRNIAAIHIANEGVANARNIGIDLAKGEYLSFLDADDCLCKNAFDDSLAELLRGSNYDIIGHGYIQANHNLRMGRIIHAESGEYKRDDRAYNKQAGNRHPCSYIFKKSIIGNIRYPKGIKYNEDTTFLFLVTRQAKSIFIIDRSWFLYRNNIHSAVHKNKLQNIFTDEIAAWAWCKSQCTDRNDILDCEGMIYSLAVQYIKLASADNIDSNIILSHIKNCKELQDILKDEQDFWRSEESKAIFTSFLENPAKEQKRLRKKQRKEKLLFTIARLPVFRQMYFALKYKEDTRQYRY